MRHRLGQHGFEHRPVGQPGQGIHPGKFGQFLQEMLPGRGIAHGAFQDGRRYLRLGQIVDRTGAHHFERQVFVVLAGQKNHRRVAVIFVDHLRKDRIAVGIGKPVIQEDAVELLRRAGHKGAGAVHRFRQLVIEARHLQGAAYRHPVDIVVVDQQDL